MAIAYFCDICGKMMEGIDIREINFIFSGSHPKVGEPNFQTIECCIFCNEKIKGFIRQLEEQNEGVEEV